MVKVVAVCMLGIVFQISKGISSAPVSVSSMFPDTEREIPHPSRRFIPGEGFVVVVSVTAG